MPSQQQVSKTPVSLRDSWQTPQWLFDWAHDRFNFDIDLAASEVNRKMEDYIPESVNSLRVSWLNSFADHYRGWCNPPYSETGKWLKKAWEEAQKGFCSVLLVPTPNGENGYRDYVFGKASEIIFINGRVAFELPDGNGGSYPVAGNTRGSCLIVYNRTYEGPTAISWQNRDDMIRGNNVSEKA